jgi:hypothetical protein
MPQVPYLDNRGSLVPITNGDLMFPSRPHKVVEYGIMYTWTLVRKARLENLDLELFLELHRRAAEQLLKDGTLVKWNREGTCWDHFSNARLIREYDAKWVIIKADGFTYLPAWEK